MDSVTMDAYLRRLGYHPPADETYNHIEEWLEWYQGTVDRFHTYKVYNGSTVKKENRYRLGMAKKVAEDWADLLLNEKVSIRAGDYTERLQQILERNHFRVRGNRLVELSYALGTGAFVEYLYRGEILIDYVRADMIRPLSWDNGEITECAFGSYCTWDDREYLYLQIHRRGRREQGERPGEYYIENRYLDKNTGQEVDFRETICPVAATGAGFPFFQIITPNICNNVELDSPMGISVYGNAVEQLKACDLIYDSYVNEFILGKKRILVPISLARMEMQRDGGTAPVFDPEDTIYYQMPADKSSDNKPVEIDMSIRAQEHEAGLQRMLDLCSFKCGLGTKRYQFSGASVRTATEVISERSDLFQSLKKNELLIEAAIRGLVRAVAYLDGEGTDVEVSVDFDDSIIEDAGTSIERNIKLVQGGLRSRVSAIMEIAKCPEKEAMEELARINRENGIADESEIWEELGAGNSPGLDLKGKF